MRTPPPYPGPFRFRPVLALLIAACAIATGFLPARAADPLPAESPLRTIEQIDAYLASHPEARTRGTGYKPYMRFKWFAEQRRVQDTVWDPAARRAAWEEGLRRQASAVRGSWFELGPTNVSGRVRALSFHPTDPLTIYAAAASGGPWKTTDGGDSWFPLGDGFLSMSTGAICVLPADPEVVLVGTGEGLPWELYSPAGVGILRSTDGGASFSPTSLTYGAAGSHGVHVIRANPLTGTILAGASDGLWRSTDQGDTWTDVRTGGDYFDVAWKPGDANRVYACKGDDSAGNNVKVSTDDGLTWTKAGTGQPASVLIGPTRLAVTPAAPSTIYALMVTQPFDPSVLLGVYRSTDDGATWTLRNGTQEIVTNQGWWNTTFCVSPTNADDVAGGGIFLWGSLNGGVNWSPIDGGDGSDWYSPDVHSDHHFSAYHPLTGELWVTSDGGVWKSPDRGATWIERNNGLATYQFYDICLAASDDYVMYGGTQDQGTDGRPADTTVWAQGLPADGMVCEIDPTNANHVYAEIQEGGHYWTLNPGGDWSNWNWGGFGLTGLSNWVAPVAMDPANASELYTATLDGVFRTLNGMSSWTQVATHSPVWIATSTADPTLVWSVGAATHVSTDNGSTWTAVTPFGGAYGTPTKILAHPTDAGSALVTFSGYGAGVGHVARTTDLGGSWTDVTGDLPSHPVNAVAIDPAATDHWFLGTDTGVWLSTNDGAHWTPYGAGLPGVVVSDLQIRESTRKLVAGTYGRGAWETDLDVETGAPEVAAASRHLMLDAPRPNPAAGDVFLRFAARHDGEVTLDIHDVAGRRIASVDRWSRGDGVIRIAVWPTENVPSGVYFAVLRAGGERVSRKIVLAR